MKRHLETAWGGESEKGLEADDLIGMAASSAVSSELSPIIVSIDKDFKTVPCRLYNPDKPELGVIEITSEQADYWFMYQTLTGDSADNYKGCPGVGPKKAEKLLEDKTTLYDMWQVVLKAYDSSGLSSRHALTQARVARILRYGEYNFGMGKVKLWHPPKEPK
jgi:DNA polymerase-1